MFIYITQEKKNFYRMALYVCYSKKKLYMSTSTAAFSSFKRVRRRALGGLQETRTAPAVSPPDPAYPPTGYWLRTPDLEGQPHLTTDRGLGSRHSAY